MVMRADPIFNSATVTVSALSKEERKAVWLARLCKQALVAEAELTPKPGLVDRRGAGSHNDLSLSVMRRSALAIEPYFYQMALISSGAYASQQLRERLAAIGRDAERAMYRTTGGSNSHKGAIWVLGLLASAASIAGEDTPATAIAEIARSIAGFHDSATLRLVTHGHVVAERYGVRGARGEALEGFPHVVHVGLPTLQAKRSDGATESVARMDTLLSIMSRLDDTCVLYRGKAAALEAVRDGALRVIAAGGCGSELGEQQLRQLDGELLALGVSPGGSADLLAATLFLDAVELRQNEVQEDRSWSEDTDGTN
jgi:triphosphoribosyl-dephospho-CoA synthase